MFKFLTSIFRRRSTAATQPAVPTPRVSATSRAPEAAPGVEVASLSLRAILDKLPADLKSNVNQMPEESVKVVLPVNTIMKQLPSGCVKMSLASLYRQAPVGTFRGTGGEDKRMVDVPMREVFKTINPSRLQRRAQVDYSVPDDIKGLFGDQSGSHSVAAPSADPVPAPEPVKEPAKILRMPKLTPEPPASGRIEKAPEPDAAPAAPLKLDGVLTLSLVELASGWNEGIRSELSVLTGDIKVVIPVGEVATGLQKGKVAFTWAQLRKWLTPACSTAIAIPDDATLVLPLKVVAPAFVAASGATKRKSNAAKVNEKLPDFFGPTAGQTPAEAPAAPEPEVPAEAPAPLPKMDEAAAIKPITLVAEPVSEEGPTESGIAPAYPPPSGKKSKAAKAAPAATEDAPAPAAEVPAPALELVATAEPTTLAQLFSKPGQTEWSPNDLVKSAAALPGVLGTVIALEEGLVVAQQLPEGLAADTFAAFMPQIFGRIDKYTGEMQLGDTAEISIVTVGGPCQIFRRGKVFVAFLGSKETKLPSGLHLVADEVSSKNS